MATYPVRGDSPWDITLKAYIDGLGGLNALGLVIDPLQIANGAITRNSGGAATGFAVEWPDGTAGVYTATTVSTAFPEAVDAFTITYAGSPTRTFTQPTVTRDASGRITNRPKRTVA